MGRVVSTNLEKCTITPIRCSAEVIQAIQEVFPSRLHDFPAKYQGAPLSLSRLNGCVEQGLIDKVHPDPLRESGAKPKKHSAKGLPSVTLGK